MVEAIAAVELPINDQAGELVATVEALDGLVINSAPRGEDLVRVEALDAGKAPGLVEAIAAAELPTNDQAGELIAIVEALDAGKALPSTG